FWWLCDVATPATGQRSDGEDAEQDHDSLNDVIQDFEDTLHSSHGDHQKAAIKPEQFEKRTTQNRVNHNNKASQGVRGGPLEPLEPKLLEKRLPPDGGDSITDFKSNTKVTEEHCRRHVYTKEEQRNAEQLLDMIFGDNKLEHEIENGEVDGTTDIEHRRKSTRQDDASRHRSDSASSSESIDTISSLNYPSSSNSSASRQLEATMASLSPLGPELYEPHVLTSSIGMTANSLKPLGTSAGSAALLSPYRSTRVTIDRTVLAKIRNQLSACLAKMRDLELQARAVPVLQVKMSVLKEEKRLLKLQLKAKNKLRDGEIAPSAHERPMSSTTGVSTAGSSLSVSSTSAMPLTNEHGTLAGISHPCDESLRNQPRLPIAPGCIQSPSLLSLHNAAGPRGPPLPKLEPLKVEELPLPTVATRCVSTSAAKPRLLDACEASTANPKMSRGRRSVSGDRLEETKPPSHKAGTIGASKPRGSSFDDQSISSLQDQLWDEATGEPKYKRGEASIGGRALDKALGDYLIEASINPELPVIPKHYHHTGINCCAETRDRGTSPDNARTHSIEADSPSSSSPKFSNNRVDAKSKTLCDQCRQGLFHPKKYPRTSGTQTMPEKLKDCVDCMERRKRPLCSTAVNTDSALAAPKPPGKAAKEASTLDVCDGTSFTPKRRAPPTPPPKPAIFTRNVGVQCTTAITTSQAIQATPERIRTREVGAQSDWRTLQRAQGIQTIRTENDRSKRLDTNSVASGDYDVRHAVCDACANKRLRSIGIGDIAIYDTCCNRCAASNKSDGSVQCELLAWEAGEGPVTQQGRMFTSQQKIEMKDQEVLTDDPYCDEITE
ncbi:hypothetical protein BIW11_05160, partial [Tropilaelaps mercedesae]